MRSVNHLACISVTRALEAKLFWQQFSSFKVMNENNRQLINHVQREQLDIISFLVRLTREIRWRGGASSSTTTRDECCGPACVTWCSVYALRCHESYHIACRHRVACLICVKQRTHDHQRSIIKNGFFALLLLQVIYLCLMFILVDMFCVSRTLSITNFMS